MRGCLDGVWLSGGNWFWWWHDFLNWRFSAQRDSAGWISPCSRNSAPRWTEVDSQKPILGKSERRFQIYHRQKKFVLTCDVNCPRWGRSWHHSGGRQRHCFWRWNVNTLCNCMSRSASKSSIWRFVITEKATTRAFSWLKAATTAFTFKTLLRHYAKQALTLRSLNVKLGPRHKGHKGRAVWLA